MRPATWPIAVRVAVAGIAGTFATVVAFVTHAFSLVACHMTNLGCHTGAGAPTSGIAEMVLGSLFLTVLVLVLTGPLIAMAIVAGLIFRPSIARCPLAWSVASSVVVWLFICLVEALMPHNAYFQARSFPERLWIHILSTESLLYLFGASVSGLAFYAMSAMGRDALAT